MEPNNFKLLKMNIFLNNENKIKSYNFAMSDYDNKLLSINIQKKTLGHTK